MCESRKGVLLSNWNYGRYRRQFLDGGIKFSQIFFQMIGKTFGNFEIFGSRRGFAFPPEMNTGIKCIVRQL